jgi:DNA-binding transcriptional ArsR family regulator
MGWPGKQNGRHALRVRAPRARTDELVVEEVGDEVLVYDERTAAAHCLSGPAGAVWRACDGQTTIDEIAARIKLDHETVVRALDQLEQCELLDVPEPAGITRRDATEKLLKVGAAAAVASPLIYSIAAPTPALAASQAACLGLGCVHDCGNGSGGCKSLNCCCCNPGDADHKVCTADCNTLNCNNAVVVAICQTNGSGCNC